MCFVCGKSLRDWAKRSTMVMTWRGLPGSPAIGMHWPDCADEKDPLWRRFRDSVRGDPDGKPLDVTREELEAFLADVAERDPRFLIRSQA